MGSNGWKKSKDHYSSRKKSWQYQGLNLWLQGDRPAPKPLSHEDGLISCASFFYYIELTTCCVPQADVCEACKRSLWIWYLQALVFPSAVAKKRPFSHCVNCDQRQQAHKKMTSSIMAWISRKASTKVPITILSMFLAGRFSQKKLFFLLGFYGFVLWEAPMLWIEVMGV